MKDLASLRRRAIMLMREAITLLDEAREGIATAHLQAALDAAERAPERPRDEPEDTLPSPDLVADPALVRAIGGALAMFATLLARQGDTSVDEIARLLGIYAVATSETSAEEGLLIGCWGAILRDVADDQRGAM